MTDKRTCECKGSPDAASYPDGQYRCTECGHYRATSDVGQNDDDGPHGDVAGTTDPDASAAYISWKSGVNADWQRGARSVAFVQVLDLVANVAAKVAEIDRCLAIGFDAPSTREIPPASRETGTDGHDTPGDAVLAPGGAEIGSLDLSDLSAVGRAIDDAVDIGSVRPVPVMRPGVHVNADGSAIVQAPRSTPTLDPTADDQRANFDRIASEPRPSAVDIKRMLDELTEFGSALDEGGTEFLTVQGAIVMLDRLGVEVLRQDITADEAAATITRLEAMTGTPDDLQPLVEEARLWSDSMAGTSTRAAQQAVDIIGRLVGALNAERRKVVELETTCEEYRDKVTELANGAAGLVDDVRQSEAAYNTAKDDAELRLRQCDEAEAAERAALLQCVKVEKRRRKAKRKLRRARKMLAEARTYGDDQRQAAGEVLARQFAEARGHSNVVDCWPIVDQVAAALGMRKAGE